MRQRRILRRRLLRGASGRRFRLWRRSAERFDVTDELPALRLGQFRPHRHALPNDAIRQDPENRARFGVLNFGGAQTWCSLTAFGRIAVTFRATLLKENPARGHSVGIFFQWIALGTSFFWGLADFGIHRLLGLLFRCGTARLLGFSC